MRQPADCTGNICHSLANIRSKSAADGERQLGEQIRALGPGAAGLFFPHRSCGQIELILILCLTAL